MPQDPIDLICTDFLRRHLAAALPLIRAAICDAAPGLSLSTLFALQDSLRYATRYALAHHLISDYNGDPGSDIRLKTAAEITVTLRTLAAELLPYSPELATLRAAAEAARRGLTPQP